MKKVTSFLAASIISFSSNSFAITEADFENISGLVEQQNIEGAFNSLKSAQAGNDKLSGYALLSLGKIYLELGKPSKSLGYFEKALFASTELDAEAKAGMALAEIQLGNIRNARLLSEEALEINPDLVDGKIAYGISFEAKLSNQNLEKIFAEAMLASARSTYAGRKYAELLLRQNRISEAEEVLKKTLIKNNIDAPSLALYSEIFWLRGELEKAISYRTEAESAYREAGNIIKADEMVAWLNLEAVPAITQLASPGDIPELSGQNTDGYSDVEKEGNQTFETQPANSPTLPILTLPERQLFQPLSEPEDMPVDVDKGFFTGSGIILANGHLILTNKHVVEDVDYIVVRNGLGETKVAESFVVSETDDLAIIKLEKPFREDYSLRLSDFEDANTGEEIFVIGYPMAFTLGMFHPSITQGIVTNEAGFGETEGEFQISATVNPGNSGGPIFNKNGKVVGIATGGIDKKIVLDEDGYIPDGVNFGVSTSRVMSFLEQDQPKDEAQEFIYDAETLYQYMRSAVVFIVGQQD